MDWSGKTWKSQGLKSENYVATLFAICQQPICQSCHANVMGAFFQLYLIFYLLIYITFQKRISIYFLSLTKL